MSGGSIYVSFDLGVQRGERKQYFILGWQFLSLHLDIPSLRERSSESLLFHLREERRKVRALGPKCH